MSSISEFYLAALDILIEKNVRARGRKISTCYREIEKFC